MVESRLQPPAPNDVRLYAYRRPIHPELFGIFLDKKIMHSQYEADLWLLGLGHLVSFHVGDETLTELVAAPPSLLPDTGLLRTLPFNRTRQFRYSMNAIHYLANAECERMSHAVFDKVYEELTDLGHKRGLFMQFQQWTQDDNQPPLTLIEYEHRARELGIFAYHAFPDRRVMLRTQSVFSLESFDPRPQSDIFRP